MRDAGEASAPADTCPDLAAGYRLRICRRAAPAYLSEADGDATGGRALGCTVHYVSRPGGGPYAGLSEARSPCDPTCPIWKPRDLIHIQSFLWVQGSDEILEGALSSGCLGMMLLRYGSKRSVAMTRMALPARLMHSTRCVQVIQLHGCVNPI